MHQIRLRRLVHWLLAMLLGLLLLWLALPAPLARSAFWITAVAWVVTTAGIGTRMWLEGRPPVTNLYSSAPKQVVFTLRGQLRRAPAPL